MKPTKEEICECGHELSEHNEGDKMCEAVTGYCNGFEYCSCKRFTPQKQRLQKQLEEGCGEEVSTNDIYLPNEICGLGILCPSCKSLLSQKIEDKKKVLEIMENWYRNDKTCSGKPHCLINECDLCVVCFKELKQAVEKI